MLTPVFLVLGLVAAAAPVAAAEESGPVTCRRQFHLKLTPGLTMTPQEIAIEERGVYTSCSGPGTSHLTAVLDASPRARGSCARLMAAAPEFTIRWSDGTTSIGHAWAVSDPPPYVTGGGEVVQGKFAGRMFEYKLLVTPKDPHLCFSSGVTEADLVGDVTFR